MSGTNDKSAGIVSLIEQWRAERAAEFIVDLQGAVDWLTGNNTALADAYKSAIEKQGELEKQLAEAETGAASMREALVAHEIIAQSQTTALPSPQLRMDAIAAVDERYGPAVLALLAEVERGRAIIDAIERSGFDLSPCMDCGAPVVCIPDGLPLCEQCAKKQQEPSE